MFSLLVGEVLGDVDLVWANCRNFNEPDSEICDLADQAQQALRMRWQQEGLPTVTPIPPCAKKQKKDGKKRALDTGGSTLFIGYVKCILADFPFRFLSPNHFLKASFKPSLRYILHTIVI